MTIQTQCDQCHNVFETRPGIYRRCSECGYLKARAIEYVPKVRVSDRLKAFVRRLLRLRRGE